MLPLVFRMYHAIPALLWEVSLSKRTAVSSAPHTLPLAYVTCCMRVSFESGREMTSACGGGPTSSRQQPVCPLKSTVVVSLMQSPCATSGVVVLSASVPEPGCTCFGGIPYWLTVTNLLLRLSAGELFSEEVFVRVQSTI